MFKVGDVVRVKESAVEPGAEYYYSNRAITKDYGWLYIIKSHNPQDPDGYYCQSIATGASHSDEDDIYWLVYELEKADV